MKDEGKYLHLWMKYAAAIRILVKKTDNETQKLQLFKHEIENGGNKSSSGYVFSFDLIKGKAMNKVSSTAIAHDLVQILDSNKATKELLKERCLKVSMGKSFELHLEKIQ